MRVKQIIGGAVIAFGLALAAPAMSALEQAQAQNTRQEACMSWSEARSAGMMDKLKMRPASDIKARAEAKYGGKVVSFQICKKSDGLIYRLAVFRPDGNVVFVTEPAQ